MFIALICIILILIIVLIQYNSLIKLRNNVRQAKSGIDVFLNKRFDLIPNLVECVKGYSKHEKEIFEYYGFCSCDVNYGKVISYSYSNGIFNSRYINVKGDNPCSKLYGKALGIIGKIFFLFLRVKYYQLQLYLCLFIFKRHCHKSQE